MIQKLRNRYRYYKALLKKFSDPNSIFIYQMGKVGSTSLEEGIENAVHIHHFYESNHPCPVRQQGLSKFGVVSLFYRIEKQIQAFLIRFVFKRRQKTKIVTLVREPVARNLSMFFHDLDAYLFAAQTNCMNSRKFPLSTRNQPRDLIQNVFENEFDHSYVLNWFDRELKRMTGIDVYGYEFDAKKGLSSISKENVQLLLLKSENLDQNLGEIANFTGSELMLKKKNVAEYKWYADLYLEFKKNYQLDSDIRELIENSDYYKKFYS